MITKEYFIKATGREPVDDDLDRCNCEFAGEMLHKCCGWCEEHNLPKFQCGCYLINITDN